MGLGKVFKPLFAKRHREKMSPGAKERAALEEFNEKVEYVRGLIRRMGYEGYVSDKLEYEIARAIAKRFSALADYDLREIINEIYDSVDKSLNLGENLRIVESILSKYASNAYDSEYIESMYEAYQKWLESQAQELRERAESRESVADWKSVLTASGGGGGRAKSGKRVRAEKRAERAEAKGVAELRELTAKVSELASALSAAFAKLDELGRSSAQLTELTKQLTELTKQLRELKAGIEDISDTIEEIGAAHALVMGRLKELESAAKRLERELRELKDSVESTEPERESIGVRIDNRAVSESTRAVSERARSGRESALRLKLEVEVSARGARIRLGERERKVDFRKAAKWIMQL